MLMVLACIAAILFVLCALCYLQRFWYFQDIKDIEGEVPWPIIMNAFRLRTPAKLAEYLIYLPKKFKHKAKGYKVSIGFDSYISLIKSELICAVMNSQELLKKGMDYKTLEPWLGVGLLLSTGKKWTQRRKLLTPTFHFSILRGFVTTFEAIGDVLIETLRKEANKRPIEISKILSLYSLDVICETENFHVTKTVFNGVINTVIFSLSGKLLWVSIDALRNENHEYVLAVKELTNLIVKRAVSWWKRIDFLYKFSWEHKTFISLCDWAHNYTYNIIDQRRRTLTDFDEDLIDGNGVTKKFALLDMLIKSTVDGEPLSNEDIREEVDTFMFEGHDTTSAALSFTLYCLSQHPEIQEKLFREQKEILGESVNATYDDLHKMEYLEMFIKEVLRLYPPVPLIVRESEKNIPMEIGTIRPGLQVKMSPLAIHRHPEYFPDPDKFDPERFSPENINNIKPFSYIPFSGGYRNCIGQKFAMLSMKSAISKIIRNFIIHADLTFKPVLTYEIILKSKNGIWIIIEKRY